MTGSCPRANIPAPARNTPGCSQRRQADQQAQGSAGVCRVHVVRGAWRAGCAGGAALSGGPTGAGQAGHRCRATTHSQRTAPGLRSWLCRGPDIWTSSLASLCLHFPACETAITQGVPAARAVGRMERLRAGATQANGRRAARARAGVACRCPVQDGASSIPRVSPSVLSPSDFHPVPNPEPAQQQGRGVWTLSCHPGRGEAGVTGGTWLQAEGCRGPRATPGPAERHGQILPPSRPQELTLCTP